MQERPKIGVGILIFNQGKILLGKRIGAHGEHSYSAPGGHLEFGESPEACASREALEETGLNIDPSMFRPVGYTNDFFKKENKHYITLVMKADFPTDQVVQNLEPHKNESWNWYSLSDLPSPIFLPLKLWLKNIAYCKPEEMTATEL